MEHKLKLSDVAHCPNLNALNRLQNDTSVTIMREASLIYIQGVSK